MPMDARFLLFPSPVGGLNARDALDDMPANDAVQMVNFFPETTYVRVRTGLLNISGPLAPSSATINAPIDALIPWTNGVARMVMSVSGGAFYVRYSSGTGALTYGTQLSGGTATAGVPWQYLQYGALGGVYTLLFNGIDPPLYWDGTSTLKACGFSADTSGGNTTTTLNQNAIVCATSYAQRIFMAVTGSLQVWYPSTAGAFQGACDYIDLGPYCKKGGQVTNLTTWTYTSSLGGIYQVLACITSEGEVLLFNGTDPNTAADWNMVGQYAVGRPVAGSRSTCQLGPDAILLCEDGFQPLQSYLQGGQEKAPGTAISYKIGNLVQQTIAAGGHLLGWECTIYPRGNMGIINYPIPGGTFGQFVWNTTTGAWTTWSGINATCWLFFDDILMVGSQSNVLYQAEISAAQLAANKSLVQPTPAFLQTAFQFPNQSTNSHIFQLAQPTVAADVHVNITLSIKTNFQLQSGVPSVGTSMVPFSAASGVQMQAPWVGVAGFGMPVSLVLSVDILSTAFQLFHTRVLYQEAELGI